MSLINIETLPLRATLIELIQRHGFWTVLRTTFALRKEKRAVPRMAQDLSPHLRRDIGVPQEDLRSDPHLWRFRS